MKLVKILVYVFATIGVIYIALLAFAYNSSCISYPIKSAVSKNQQRKAELIVNSCKNSMESSIYLAIYNKSDAKYYTQTEISKATSTDIDLSWVSENELDVLYPKNLDIEKGARYTTKGHELNGVQVTLIQKSYLTPHSSGTPNGAP